MDASEIGADTAGDAYLPQSGNGGYRTMSISLSLRYRIARNRLDGTAELLLRAHQRLARFSLDLVGLSASARAGRRAPGGLPAGARQAADHARSGRSSPAPRSSSSSSTAAPRSPGARGAWGAIGWEELDDGVLVASQPSGAPTWFPCNDHPFDKASYRIRFETDAAYTVVANGELEDHRVVSGPGRVGLRPARAHGELPGHGAGRAGTRSGRSRSTAPRVRVYFPRPLERRGARRLRAAAADARGVRGALRPVPVRAVHGRRDGRRARDPARGAGARGLRREPRRRRTAARSGSSPTSSPTSGSATAWASPAGRTSG